MHVLTSAYSFSNYYIHISNLLIVEHLVHK